MAIALALNYDSNWNQGGDGEEVQEAWKLSGCMWGSHGRNYKGLITLSYSNTPKSCIEIDGGFIFSNQTYEMHYVGPHHSQTCILFIACLIATSPQRPKPDIRTYIISSLCFLSTHLYNFPFFSPLVFHNLFKIKMN